MDIMCAKSDQYALNDLVSMVFIRFFPHFFIVALTFDHLLIMVKFCSMFDNDAECNVV